jgi:hypothetical protein
MTNTTADETVPAGWFLSPYERDMDEYWDGNAWTGQRQPTSKDPYRAYNVPLYRLRRIVSAWVLAAAYVVGFLLAGTSLTLFAQFFIRPGGQFHEGTENIVNAIYVLFPAIIALVTVPVIVFTHRHRGKMYRTEFPNGRLPMSDELKSQLLSGAAFVGYAVLAGALTAGSQSSASSQQSTPRPTTRRTVPAKVNDSSIFRGKYTWKNLGGGSNW